MTAWEDQSGNGFHAIAEGQQCPTLAADDMHLGLPAIRFDGRSQYLRAATGLNMNLPGPFTLVVVATVKDGWPKAIFSPVPEGNQNDYESPGSFAFHCTHGNAGSGALRSRAGLGSGPNLGLTAPCAKPARPENVVFVRPVTVGEAVFAYLDGQLIDLGEVSARRRRSSSPRVTSSVPAGRSTATSSAATTSTKSSSTIASCPRRTSVAASVPFRTSRG